MRFAGTQSPLARRESVGTVAAGRKDQSEGGVRWRGKDANVIEGRKVDRVVGGSQEKSLRAYIIKKATS